MVARFVGAGLGLLAFCVATTAGLYARNPVHVTLSRSILALFVFCLLGLVLGVVAEKVIDEHKRVRSSGIKEQYRRNMSPSATDGRDEVADGHDGEPIEA